MDDSKLKLTEFRQYSIVNSQLWAPASWSLIKFINQSLLTNQVLDPLDQSRFIRIFLHDIQPDKLRLILQQR